MRDVLDDFRNVEQKADKKEDQYRKRLKEDMYRCRNVHSEDQKTTLYVEGYHQQSA